MGNSLLAEMDESTDEIEDIFQEFILVRNNNKNSVVYAFFEGKDDYSYYSSRIKRYTEKEIVPYQSNGKEKSLILYSMLKNNTNAFDENTILFFIDKDFDENNIKSDDIYVTPGYAIENFYATDTVLDEFLKGELQISKFSIGNKKSDYDNVIRYYTEEREKFIDRITLLNTWYSLQRKKYKNIDGINEPDLSAIKSAYCKKLRGDITIEKLKQLTPNYIEVNELEIESEKRRLLTNPINNFRGKYFEEFMVKTLNIILTDANSPKNLFSKKRKTSLNFGKDNLISSLSHYADTPICLDKYLKNIFVTAYEVASDIDL